VARQRQRARDRKARGADQGTPKPEQQPPAHPGEIHRENIPGSLDHSSFAEEEFEADLVAGAEGVPLDGAAAQAFGEGAELVAADVAAANAIEDEDGVAPDHRKTGAPTRGGGNRVFNFLKASWAELQRVQWPDRRQTAQATGVVAGFVVIAGLYLGLADEVANKIVDYILNNSL
jgi:preprotein translocase subunit SecE